MDDGLGCQDGHPLLRTLPCEYDLLARHVLPAGIVPGQQILVAGEPGIGKSTFLLQALIGFSRAGIRCMYATSEQDKIETLRRLEQVFDGPGHVPVEVVEVKSIEDLNKAIIVPAQRKALQVLIVDSLQGMDLSSYMLREWEGFYNFVGNMRTRGVAAFYVAHLTKDDRIAGPRKAEHLVDTVMLFDKALNYRLIRVTKNRFGPSIEHAVLCSKDSVGRLKVLRQNVGPMVSRAIGFNRAGLFQVEAKVEFGPASGILIRKPALSGIPKEAYAKIASILRGIGVDLSGMVVTCSKPGNKHYFPEDDLAIAMALLASHMRTEIPYAPVFSGELSLDGHVLPVPPVVPHGIVAEYKAERLAVATHTFVLHESSARVVWEETAKLQLIPLLLLYLKTLKEVGEEFLLGDAAATA